MWRRCRCRPTCRARCPGWRTRPRASSRCGAPITRTRRRCSASRSAATAWRRCTSVTRWASSPSANTWARSTDCAPRCPPRRHSGSTPTIVAAPATTARTRWPGWIASIRGSTSATRRRPRAGSPAARGRTCCRSTAPATCSAAISSRPGSAISTPTTWMRCSRRARAAASSATASSAMRTGRTCPCVRRSAFGDGILARIPLATTAAGR